MHNTYFKWDTYSDQPFPIENKAYKKKMRYKNIGNILLTTLMGLIVLPFILLIKSFLKPKRVTGNTFIGMGVNLDKEQSAQFQAEHLKELGITTINIRFPLWDIENLSAYKDFIASFTNCTIMLTLIPSRDHIEDKNLLQHDISLIFSHLDFYISAYQIGNAINRTKWGFFSMGEYIRFYKTIHKEHKHQNLTSKLYGPSVIDYEYYYFIHVLFSFIPTFDGVSALLYVDRRGAPENKQQGLNFLGKIDTLFAIASLSPFTRNDIKITEANWPLRHTAPYAPTSETECVSQEDYCNYMLRYYLIAFASQKVSTVYWHQLVAKGYGLIDQQTGERYPSFNALKKLILHLKDAQYSSHNFTSVKQEMQFKNKTYTLRVLWSLIPYTYTIQKQEKLYTLIPQHDNQTIITVGMTPIILSTKGTIHYERKS